MATDLKRITLPFDKLLSQVLAASTASEGDVQELLDRLLALLLQAFDESVGGILLLEGNHLHLAAHRGPPSREAAGELGALLASAGCRSLLALPLVGPEALLGYLFLGAAHPLTLDEQARQDLQSLGRALGLVIQNARLLEAQARFRAQLAQQQRTSEALYEVSLAFVSTTDLDKLLDLIVHAAVNTIEAADNCVLHLLDQETGELLPRALSFTPVRRETRGRTHMRLGHGVAGMALASGEVINVPNVTQDPRFLGGLRGRTFTSMVAIPLRLGERRIGTLSVDAAVPNAFSLDDERLLLTLGTLAAAAIENARLVGDLQQSLTRLQTTQAQLVQSEKLSAIGQLIAGVAHELNNPLTAVLGYTQLLQAEPHLDTEMREDLDKIYAQAQRAASIVQNLLTFAREHKSQRRFVDVNEVIKRALELSAYQLRNANVQVITRLDVGVLGCIADAGQLQQVFINLINNARDALLTTPHRGGHLTIESTLRDDKIQVRFIDDGPGLSPEVKQHLFEPFFTTKEVGEGTGLGLSICFGIVTDHGGRIWAESEPGQGATFIVELPASKAPRRASSETRPPQEIPAPVQQKRILVVDDEEDVAGVLGRFLAQEGYEVLVAHSGAEALALLEEIQGSLEGLDLILSDIKMPGLSGPALYERLRRQAPELAQRVLFITGDTLDRRTQAFLRRVRLPYVRKPFDLEELRRQVSRLLATLDLPAAPLSPPPPDEDVPA